MMVASLLLGEQQGDEPALPVAGGGSLEFRPPLVRPMWRFLLATGLLPCGAP